MGLREVIAQKVKNRQNFRYGNVSGHWMEDHLKADETGQLPSLERDQLNFHLTDKDVYVVFSYDTPIAWSFDQKWTIPNITYSTTTTKHQNAIREIG